MADRGDPIAATIMGVCFAEGWGASSDEKVAREYLAAAAEVNPVARYLLARLLFKSPETAVEAHLLARIALDAGTPEAATLLGDAHKLGLGVEASETESSKLYQKGGELGDGAGFAKLGLRYVDDRGQIANFLEARHWFEKAYAAGYLGITAYLADILIDHVDPPDVRRGLQLLHHAAERKDFGSLMKLSRVYRDGLFGIPPDKAKAREYSRLAKEAMGESSS